MTYRWDNLFVLGAGASKPYGYPTGAELKYKIIDALKNQHGDLFNIMRIGYTPEVLKEFAEDFQASRMQSIDAYLMNQAEDKKKLGVVAISAIILDHKEKENLYPDKQDWFSYLFNLLYGVPTSELPQNKSAFITFNYDHSLSDMLYESLHKAHFHDPKKSLEYFSTIPILNVYGKIGHGTVAINSNSMSGDTHTVKYEQAVRASFNIKVIYDERVEAIPNDFQKLFYETKQITFLGFGYDKMNLSRLGVSWDQIKCRVTGTAYDLHQGERERILENMAPLKPYLDDSTVDCLWHLKRI